MPTERNTTLRRNMFVGLRDRHAWGGEQIYYLGKNYRVTLVDCADKGRRGETFQLSLGDTMYSTESRSWVERECCPALIRFVPLEDRYPEGTV